jgi:hypothetical protein
MYTPKPSRLRNEAFCEKQHNLRTSAVALYVKLFVQEASLLPKFSFSFPFCGSPRFSCLLEHPQSPFVDFPYEDVDHRLDSPAFEIKAADV